MKVFTNYILVLGCFWLAGTTPGNASDPVVTDLVAPLDAIRKSSKLKGIDVPTTDDRFLEIYFSTSTPNTELTNKFYERSKRLLYKILEGKSKDKALDGKCALGWLTLAACYGDDRSLNIIKSLHLEPKLFDHLGIIPSELNTLKGEECASVLLGKKYWSGGYLYRAGEKYETFERKLGKKSFERSLLMYKWSWVYFNHKAAQSKYEQLCPEKKKNI